MRTTQISFQDAKTNPRRAGQSREMGKMRATRKLAPKFVMSAAIAAAAVSGISARPAGAATVTLQDFNSLVKLSTASNMSQSQDGVTTWSVNGINQLNQQWFWYRVGNSGAGQDLSSLTPSAPVTADTDGNGHDNYASILYTGTGFTVGVQYLLAGGPIGSNVSDLTAIARIINTGSSSLTFNLINFNDFSLGNAAGDRSITLTNNNTGLESNSAGAQASVIVSPKATQYDANNSAATLIAGLDSGSLIPLPDHSTASGPDPAFGFGYDVTIKPGSSYTISADEQVAASIPEPTSSAAFLGVGGLFLTRPRRREGDPDPRAAQVAGA